jgi:hypothetical protein
MILDENRRRHPEVRHFPVNERNGDITPIDGCALPTSL